ncbi:MAG TPA: type IV toxin-antitoxin system AbiEi family antitoxin domain-containing protein [Polyangiaceae bacterium]|nr:type IV toxin-antitoxin system AbiEi family antitoxin domain-containing protein [Polyangiaceae bacterium]
MPSEESGPNWNRLFDFALGQDGHFTTKQAAEAGYSSQLLIKYIKSGRIIRVMRGIYRVVHFPAGEHEGLTTLWLWAEGAGVFSHETALSLHQLSDVLPRQVHLTLPVDWANRRLRIPKGLVLYYAEVPKRERVDLGPISVTRIWRTLIDCVAAHVSPDLIEQAVRQARARGLIDRNETKVLRARMRVA